MKYLYLILTAFWVSRIIDIVVWKTEGSLILAIGFMLFMGWATYNELKNEDANG